MPRVMRKPNTSRYQLQAHNYMPTEKIIEFSIYFRT